MVKLSFWFMLMLVMASLIGQALPYQKVMPLSDSAYISVFSCAPGGELYSQFGHSAIGVFDPQQNLEVVYNYGTFSFNTPNFYVKFAAGKLLYELSSGYYSRFMYEYQLQSRTVTESRLNLTPQQKQVLFNLLYENNLPENRYYQYDFFFDNCATRIVDMLYTALADSLYFTPNTTTGLLTYRQHIHHYLANSYWSCTGIDLVLGSVIDKEASARQAAFLPDYLLQYLNHSTINGKPAVVKTTYPNQGSFIMPKTPWPIRPGTLLWAVVILTLFFHYKLPNRSWVVYDRILFAFTGILGLIIALLWFATDHGATLNNYNLIWCHPLYLAFPFVVRQKAGKLQQWAGLLALATSGLFLAGWFVWPQTFNLAFLPLLLLLLWRGWAIFKRNN
jgi:hypothetical protein